MAAIAPGTQPAMVKSSTSKMTPQPLSRTASGGNRIQRRILPQPMIVGSLMYYELCPSRYRATAAHYHVRLTFSIYNFTVGNNLRRLSYNMNGLVMQSAHV